MPKPQLTTVPNVDSVYEQIQTKGFAEDPETQLRVLSQVFLLASPDRFPLLEQISRLLGVDADRLLAIHELRDNVDRLKALTLPPDRPPQRLDAEHIFPTHGWFGDYLHWAGPTSAPLAWHFWSAAALLSAAARRELWVDAGMDEPVFLCNYYFLVGPSGSGKSTAVKKAKDVLKRTNRKLFALGQEAPAPYDPTIYTGPPSATLEAWLDEVSTHYATIVSNGGVQQPALVMRPDCCCFIAQDEAVVLLGSDTHSADRWFNFFFQASDCPDEWRDSKVTAKAAGNSRELYNVALTTLLGSAPEHLTQRVSSAVFSGGYIGRTIMSYRTHSGRMHSSRANTDPIRAERLSEYLVKIATRNPGRLALTDQARDYYDDFLADNHQRIRTCDPKFVGSYERAGWHTIKTAGVLALGENPMAREIRLEHVTLARELVELERPGSERVLGGSRTYDPGEQIVELERAISSLGQIDYPGVMLRSRGIYATEPKLRAALQNLLSSGRIRCFPPTTESRVVFSAEGSEPRLADDDEEED